jgi:hypothetical protein
MLTARISTDMRPPTSNRRPPATRRWNLWIWVKSKFGSTSDVPDNEIPYLLTLPWLVFQFVCQLLLTGAVIGLLLLSDAKNGIATVEDPPSARFDSGGLQGGDIVFQGLYWTALPAWIVGAYGSLWSAAVDQLKDSQPTMELYKHERKTKPRFRRMLPPTFGKRPAKSTAEKTLWLDYGKYIFPFHAIWIAFKNRHFLVAYCLFIKLAIFAVSGLSTFMHIPALVPHNTTAYFNANIDFNEGLNTAIDQGQTLTAMEVVSSRFVHGGGPQPWTTADYAVLPFELESDGIREGNMSTITKAYSSILQCDTFLRQDLINGGNVSIERAEDELTKYAYVTFSLRHHNCPWAQRFVVSSNVTSYSRTFTKTDCGLDNGQGRLGLITANYDPSAPFLVSNFSLMICKPTFRQSIAEVTVQADGLVPGLVHSVTAAPPSAFLPFFWRRWIHDLDFFWVNDPTSTINTDGFGRLVYTYSMKKTRSYPTDPAVIGEALPFIYRALFASFVSLGVYLPAPEPRRIEGVVTTQTVRLFVIRSIAIPVIVLMLAAMIATSWLVFYSYQNQDILKKHKDLILGHALLVKSSDDVWRYVDEIEMRAAEKSHVQPSQLDGKDLSKFAEKDHDLKSWECWVEDNKVRISRGQAARVDTCHSSTAPRAIASHSSTPSSSPTLTSGIPLRNISFSSSPIQNIPETPPVQNSPHLPYSPPNFTTQASSSHQSIASQATLPRLTTTLPASSTLLPTAPPQLSSHTPSQSSPPRSTPAPYFPPSGGTSSIA